MEETTLGQRIEAARGRALLTQGELAEASGLSLLTINRLENDRTDMKPRPSTLRRIAAALGVDVRWLAFGEEPVTPKKAAA